MDSDVKFDDMELLILDEDEDGDIDMDDIRVLDSLDEFEPECETFSSQSDNKENENIESHGSDETPPITVSFMNSLRTVPKPAEPSANKKHSELIQQTLQYPKEDADAGHVQPVLTGEIKETKPAEQRVLTEDGEEQSLAEQRILTEDGEEQSLAEQRVLSGNGEDQSLAEQSVPTGDGKEQNLPEQSVPTGDGKEQNLPEQSVLTGDENNQNSLPIKSEEQRHVTHSSDSVVCNDKEEPISNEHCSRDNDEDKTNDSVLPNNDQKRQMIVCSLKGEKTKVDGLQADSTELSLQAGTIEPSSQNKENYLMNSRATLSGDIVSTPIDPKEPPMMEDSNQVPLCNYTYLSLGGNQMNNIPENIKTKGNKPQVSTASGKREEFSSNQFLQECPEIISDLHDITLNLPKRLKMKFDSKKASKDSSQCQDSIPVSVPPKSSTVLLNTQSRSTNEDVTTDNTENKMTHSKNQIITSVFNQIQTAFSQQNAEEVLMQHKDGEVLVSRTEIKKEPSVNNFEKRVSTTEHEDLYPSNNKLKDNVCVVGSDQENTQSVLATSESLSLTSKSISNQQDNCAVGQQLLTGNNKSFSDTSELEGHGKLLETSAAQPSVPTAVENSVACNAERVLFQKLVSQLTKCTAEDRKIFLNRVMQQQFIKIAPHKGDNSVKSKEILIPSSRIQKALQGYEQLIATTKSYSMSGNNVFPSSSEGKKPSGNEILIASSESQSTSKDSGALLSSIDDVTFPSERSLIHKTRSSSFSSASSASVADSTDGSALEKPSLLSDISADHEVEQSSRLTRSTARQLRSNTKLKQTNYRADFSKLDSEDEGGNEDADNFSDDSEDEYVPDAEDRLEYRQTITDERVTDERVTRSTRQSKVSSTATKSISSSGVSAYVWHCFLCSKECKVKSGLFSHIRHAHSYYKFTNGLHCTHCGQPSTNFTEIVVHEKKFHGTNLSCCFCGVLYESEVELRCHIAQHLQPQVYVCMICKLFFMTTEQAEAHATKHVGTDSLITKTVFQKCHFCGLIFVDYNTLAAHFYEKHDDILKYKCDACSQKFFSVQALNVHRSDETGFLDGKKIIVPKIQIKVNLPTQLMTVETDSRIGKTDNRNTVSVTDGVTNKKGDNTNVTLGHCRTNPYSATESSKLPGNSKKVTLDNSCNVQTNEHFCSPIRSDISESSPAVTTRFAVQNVGNFKNPIFHTTIPNPVSTNSPGNDGDYNKEVDKTASSSSNNQRTDPKKLMSEGKELLSNSSDSPILVGSGLDYMFHSYLQYVASQIDHLLNHNISFKGTISPISHKLLQSMYQQKFWVLNLLRGHLHVLLNIFSVKVVTKELNSEGEMNQHQSYKPAKSLTTDYQGRALFLKLLHNPIEVSDIEIKFTGNDLEVMIKCVQTVNCLYENLWKIQRASLFTVSGTSQYSRIALQHYVHWLEYLLKITNMHWMGLKKMARESSEKIDKSLIKYSWEMLQQKARLTKLVELEITNIKPYMKTCVDDSESVVPQNDASTRTNFGDVFLSEEFLNNITLQKETSNAIHVIKPLPVTGTIDLTDDVHVITDDNEVPDAGVIDIDDDADDDPGQTKDKSNNNIETLNANEKCKDDQDEHLIMDCTEGSDDETLKAMQGSSSNSMKNAETLNAKTEPNDVHVEQFIMDCTESSDDEYEEEGTVKEADGNENKSSEVASSQDHQNSCLARNVVVEMSSAAGDKDMILDCQDIKQEPLDISGANVDLTLTEDGEDVDEEEIKDGKGEDLSPPFVEDNTDMENRVIMVVSGEDGEELIITEANVTPQKQYEKAVETPAASTPDVQSETTCKAVKRKLLSETPDQSISLQQKKLRLVQIFNSYLTGESEPSESASDEQADSGVNNSINSKTNISTVKIKQEFDINVKQEPAIQIKQELDSLPETQSLSDAPPHLSSSVGVKGILSESSQVKVKLEKKLDEQPTVLLSVGSDKNCDSQTMMNYYESS